MNNYLTHYLYIFLAGGLFLWFIAFQRRYRKTVKIRRGRAAVTAAVFPSRGQDEHTHRSSACPPFPGMRACGRPLPMVFPGFCPSSRMSGHHPFQARHPPWQQASSNVPGKRNNTRAIRLKRPLEKPSTVPGLPTTVPSMKRWKPS